MAAIHIVDAAYARALARHAHVGPTLLRGRRIWLVSLRALVSCCTCILSLLGSTRSQKDIEEKVDSLKSGTFLRDAISHPYTKQASPGQQHAGHLAPEEIEF